MSKQSNDLDRFAERMQELAEFFRTTDTEPICINPNDSKSIEKGVEEIGNRIQDSVNNKGGKSE